jgi:hypothetical protein
VLGDPAELGASDLTQAVRLPSEDEVTWRVTISLPVNQTYTYQYYKRLFFARRSEQWRAHRRSDHGQHGKRAHRARTQDHALPLRPRRPVLHWRQDDGAYATLALSDMGPGRGPGERR